MELWQYWRLVQRRWWIVATVTLLTAAVAWGLSPQVQGRYVATLRVLLSVPPETRTGSYFGYDTYYSWVSSEYLVDDFAEVVQSGRFLEDMRRELGATEADGLSFTGAPATEKTHRVLTLRISGRHPEQVQRAAEAAERVLTQRAADYFAQLAAQDARVVVLDPPAVAIEGGGMGRLALNFALRVAVGLLGGIGLAFLVHALDTRLYEGREVEELLHLPVLGEIPARR
ncbi:MAG: hypothetical protein HY689_00655 [Chloroflexi bacterium]|nr:hypothetical protein [Chloroflexota bacterium]